MKAELNEIRIALNAIRIAQPLYTHYTMLGSSIQPSCADTDGFLAYRPDYSLLTMDEWTASEHWIRDMELAIEVAR